MGTDDLFKKRKGIKVERKVNLRHIAPYRYLIVCEGQKTEPNYFEGLKVHIHKNFADKIDVKIDLDIEGTGRNTQSLVDCALMLRSLSEKIYGNVWVVFDKDSFSDEDFNNAIIRAEENEIKSAWSNESIELWFLLHFEYLDAALHRTQYIIKLNKYFRKNNLNNGKYGKNLPNIFTILSQIGNLEQAIDRSKKLEKFHDDLGSERNSLKNPCTMVFKLVEELLEFSD